MRALRLFVLFLVAVLLIPSIGLAKGKSSSGGTVHVKGYTRKDGTYVAPYTRRAPGSGSSSAYQLHTDKPDTSYLGPPDPPASLPPTTPKPKPTSFAAPIAKTAEATIPNGEKLEGKVVGIIDGNTLILLVNKTQYKIRLSGIDAPESGQPFSTQSKKALSEKVFGKMVHVLSQGQDTYGRTLGIVYDAHCVNTVMVREGWAWHYKEYSDNKTLATAEDDAKKAKIGLWADLKPIPPWEWQYNEQRRIAESDPSGESKPLAQQVEQKTEKKYWMTNSSGKRHNAGCHYYQKSNGHPCGPNDGIPCKICGG